MGQLMKVGHRSAKIYGTQVLILHFDNPCNVSICGTQLKCLSKLAITGLWDFLWTWLFADKLVKLSHTLWCHLHDGCNCELTVFEKLHVPVDYPALILLDGLSLGSCRPSIIDLACQAIITLWLSLTWQKLHLLLFMAGTNLLRWELQSAHLLNWWTRLSELLGIRWLLEVWWRWLLCSLIVEVHQTQQTLLILFLSTGQLSQSLLLLLSCLFLFGPEDFDFGEINLVRQLHLHLEPLVIVYGWLLWLNGCYKGSVCEWSSFWILSA